MVHRKGSCLFPLFLVTRETAEQNLQLIGAGVPAEGASMVTAAGCWLR